ncbi:hypothetical protein GGI25_003623 [Coemansia spiralis]|uniref:Importin subunit alpha n=2 Tax=Coemansia TaxID=4863 RepID=A0A9W8G5M0_9FUNG|nr:armadillo-type protein [Coemansia spiralis]KAJ1996150.1 hypothetical protein EDC05_000040 [Coemansia umbellata]KAJ2626093.1 hypothetical protein GGI26_000177 [Coemansia sp. RSA 1358]KAJ2676236.1 hypothetical protein GGI25_003623 [Coemansia spiralis]
MPPRFKELYKHVPSAKETRQRRLLHEAQLRRLQREQVFMGKRLRYRTPQESETESEYEFTPSDTAEIARGLKSADHEERIKALESLSMKLEQPSEELRKFVLEGECVHLLIELLNATNAEEKLQSLWCLTNIAANESNLAEKVFPAVPYLLSLLSSDGFELKNQAIWALGNLAAEGENAREYLYANGALVQLVDILRSATDPTILQTVCFAISNMARMPSTYFNVLFELKLPQAIANQLYTFKDDCGCIAELAWVCTYLTASSSEQQLDQLISTGLIDTLLQHAQPLDNAKLIPVIRTLGNIAAGTDTQTHKLVSNSEFLKLIVRCIEVTSSRAVEKEALWVLSSVTASREEDVDAAVQIGIIPDLVRIVEKQNFDIKKEAAFSLLNIAIVGQRVVDLPNDRLVNEFVEFIKSQDDQLVRMGVQYISIIFEHLPAHDGIDLLRKVPGGIDALENLVAVTDNDEIRLTVSTLIDMYYGEEVFQKQE